MDLTGRYLKVLDDSSKTHYPCIKGDYMLFNNQSGNIQFWGIEGQRSNYWGSNLHLSKEFELMPEGFDPNSISYEIY